MWLCIETTTHNGKGGGMLGKSIFFQAQNCPRWRRGCPGRLGYSTRTKEEEEKVTGHEPAKKGGRKRGVKHRWIRDRGEINGEVKGQTLRKEAKGKIREHSFFVGKNGTE